MQHWPHSWKSSSSFVELDRETSTVADTPTGSTTTRAMKATTKATRRTRAEQRSQRREGTCAYVRYQDDEKRMRSTVTNPLHHFVWVHYHFQRFDDLFARDSLLKRSLSFDCLHLVRDSSQLNFVDTASLLFRRLHVSGTLRVLPRLAAK